MAEIKIEKKKPIWPWILVILIILAAIFLFWYYNDRPLDSSEDLIPMDPTDSITRADEDYRYEETRRDTTALYTGTYGTVNKEHAFADYFMFVDNKDNRSIDKNYYRSAFFKLITATKREAEIENVDVSNNISTAMEHAEQMTNDPTTSPKADHVKKAANEISKALKTIQEKEFDNLKDDAKNLDDSVSGIDGGQSVESQSNNIDAFFDRAAKLLQKMHGNNNNY